MSAYRSADADADSPATEVEYACVRDDLIGWLVSEAVGIPKAVASKLKWDFEMKTLFAELSGHHRAHRRPNSAFET